MSTGLIIAIVVAAVVILGLLLFLMPRMRTKAREREAQRELHQRRERVADEHRTEATERERSAELAERKARMAQQEAERERAEANLRRERAEMHERGEADDELIEEHERDRFQGVAGTADRDGDGHTMDDRARSAMDRDENGMRSDDMQSEGAPGSEYEQGRMDEKRFERERITDDVRDSERSNR
jgi:hypothetical protein